MFRQVKNLSENPSPQTPLPASGARRANSRIGSKRRRPTDAASRWRLTNISPLWFVACVLPLLIAIYWMTTSIAVASLIPAVQAALPALKTGLWIRAYECHCGRAKRGRLLFLFYVADALWLSAASAAMTILTLAILASWFGWQPNLTRVATALLTVASATLATTLLGLAASYLAWRSALRVWVHPRTFRWCQGNASQLPHLHLQPPRLNHGVFIVGTGLVVPSLVIGTMLLIAMTANGERLTTFQSLASAGVMLLFYVVQPLLAIVAYAMLSSHILAKQPHDCWQEE